MQVNYVWLSLKELTLTKHGLSKDASHSLAERDQNANSNLMILFCFENDLLGRGDGSMV